MGRKLHSAILILAGVSLASSASAVETYETYSRKCYNEQQFAICSTTRVLDSYTTTHYTFLVDRSSRKTFMCKYIDGTKIDGKRTRHSFEALMPADEGHIAGLAGSCKAQILAWAKGTTPVGQDLVANSNPLSGAGAAGNGTPENPICSGQQCRYVDPATNKEVTFFDRNNDGKWTENRDSYVSRTQLINKNGSVVEGAKEIFNTSTGTWKSASPGGNTYTIGSGENAGEYGDRLEWEQAGGTQDGTVKRADGSKVIYKDGLPIQIQKKDGTIVSAEQIRKEAVKDAKNKGKGKVADDECANSMRIDPSYTCRKTTTIATAAEVTNQVMQTAGRGLVNQLGANAARRTQTGKMSDSYSATAKMAKGAFTYEAALSAANIAAGVTLAKRKQKHGRNLTELQALYEKTGDPQVAAAIEEQKQARAKADAGQFKAIVTGAQGVASAIVAKSQQKQYEDIAKSQGQIENKLAQDRVTFGGLGQAIGIGGGQSPATAGGAGGPGGLGGAGGVPGDADGDGKSDSDNLLGNGRDGGGGDQGPAHLAGGNFVPGAGGGPGGGGGAPGGMGGGGGGGSAGSPPSNEEPKAQYASDMGSKERYENAGAPGGGAKGGGGKGGGKDGADDIDLNSLLGQFLPKTTEDIGPQGGILEYEGGAGRGLASAEDPGSILDKNADLFQRVHDTYAEKTRKGQVGL